MLAKPAAQGGFSLVEVLIAGLVLAVGALGMMSLQITSINNVASAQNRTQAVFLMNDMANRMRHNKAAAADGRYITDAGSGGARVTDCELAGCSGEALAQHDIWEWHGVIIGADMGFGPLVPGLPEGNGAIVENADGSFMITVSWQEQASNKAQGRFERREVSQRLYL
jgi:type IV pilus assembly protein PilV